MSIKEVDINIGKKEIFPVKLAYGLSNREDLDALQPKKEYFFVGIITKDNKSTVVFGYARKHEEFKKAIEKDLGRVGKGWVRGQIKTNAGDKISDMDLYPLKLSDKANIKRFLLILESINAELLSSEVTIRYANTPRYFYNPTSKKITYLWSRN